MKRPLEYLAEKSMTKPMTDEQASLEYKKLLAFIGATNGESARQEIRRLREEAERKKEEAGTALLKMSLWMEQARELLERVCEGSAFTHENIRAFLNKEDK